LTLLGGEARDALIYMLVDERELVFDGSYYPLQGLRPCRIGQLLPRGMQDSRDAVNPKAGEGHLSGVQSQHRRTRQVLAQRAIHGSSPKLTDRKQRPVIVGEHRVSAPGSLQHGN
jgi:hypothetical protein